MSNERTRIKPECLQCPVGVASGTRRGVVCKFAEQRWRRDELIYREGDAARQVWYIKTGSVILRRKTHDTNGETGGRVTAVRFPGSLVGLETIVSARYADTAIAGPTTVLCRVERDELHDWLGPEDSPARTALELLLRTHDTEMTRERQLEGTAAQRVASWLCKETTRDQTLALRRRELADLLGMRPETLSRVLTRFAAQGAIAVARSRVHIADRASLEHIASGELVPGDAGGRRRDLVKGS